MRLSQKQQLFAFDMSKLLAFIFSQGWFVTLGETQRTVEQQKIYIKTGRSWTWNSQHLKKLAMDMYFFDPKGELVWDRKRLQVFGDYWEKLHMENSWGGNWKSKKDVPHFQRAG